MSSVWGVSLFVTLAVFVSLQYFAQGKCRGEWAIHSCAGGNGKRSSSMDSSREDMANMPTNNRLKRLLERYIQAGAYQGQDQNGETFNGQNPLDNGDMAMSRDSAGDNDAEYDYDKIRELWRSAVLAKRVARKK